MTTWTRDPWQLEIRCEVISHTLDNAEHNPLRKKTLGKILDGQIVCPVYK